MASTHRNPLHESSRAWCFTIYDQPGAREAVKTPPDFVRYVVFQPEICPTTGRNHLQGYCELYAPQRRARMLKWLPKCKIDPRRKSRDAARDYCMKQATREPGTTPTEIGEWEDGGQGARSDIYAVKEKLDAGVPMYQIADEHHALFLQYGNRWNAYLELKAPIDTPQYSLDQFNRPPLDFSGSCKTYFLHGPSRIGKTAFALAHFKAPLMVSQMDDLKKFNGRYDGIVFDDMSFLHLAGDHIIHLLDTEYRRSIHCRYGNATIPPNTKKIFTHNLDNIFYPESLSVIQKVAINKRHIDVVVKESLFSQTASPPGVGGALQQGGERHGGVSDFQQRNMDFVDRLVRFNND